jgi:hypothetical protein
MGKISNQEIEKYYFEMFRKDFSLPSGTVIYRDSPDVVIDGERKIGIEITNFCHKPGSHIESEQIQSNWREKITSEAQFLYEKQNGKKFEISFGFDQANPIRNKKFLIHQILELATQIQNCETGQIETEYFNKIPELSFVYLNNQEYEANKWRIVQVHDVPFLKIGAIIRDCQGQKTSL